MESPRIEEENMIKDIRNLFKLNKLKKETNDAAIKGLRNIFRLEKENKAIKTMMISEIRILLSMKKKIIISH